MGKNPALLFPFSESNFWSYSSSIAGWFECFINVQKLLGYSTGSPLCANVIYFYTANYCV
jgi:hypothetical protein